jgi:hypothetical protein
MQTVYILSDKGRQEILSGTIHLPSELGQLLRLVDGRRTDADLLAAMKGKSTIKAGGLRWLKASGYIVEVAARTPRAQATRAASAPGAVQTMPQTASEAGMRQQLADFMMQSARRWLGKGDAPYLRQIERAASIQELLLHLNPLIDAIVAKAGADAGAEFADVAAFILNPETSDATPPVMV